MFKHYTINQIFLPLNLEKKLEDNDIAFVINDLVESIPDEAYKDYLRSTGCPAYDPRMMLKIILCAYTQSVFSGRKIEAMVKDSVRMMWLAQEYEPSYRTINRFRSNKYTKELLRQCFVQFRCALVEAKEIDEEVIFIDGTKIEANANKFSFVWRKATEVFSARLIEKSNQAYNEILEKEIIPSIERESPEELTSEEMEAIVVELDDLIQEYNQEIITSGVEQRKEIRKKRGVVKQYKKQFLDWKERKEKYKQDTAIFGDRNSYSKTDKDATFMRMKDDYMGNGYLKPGYNLQIATENQYALAYDIFHNPTDTRTLIPFLDTIEENYFTLPDYIAADAGYGSEPNYLDVIEKRKRIPLITYNQYRKEQNKTIKKDVFNSENWEYDEERNSFTCPNNKELKYTRETYKIDKYGYKRDFKVYQCKDCIGCPNKQDCIQGKETKLRTIYYNEKWEEQKSYVKEKLLKEKEKRIYARRKIDVEPVFGFLKANLGFTRFSLRGKSRVHNEIGFALMAVNIRKFAAFMHQNRLSSFIFIKKEILIVFILQSESFLLIQG